MRGQSTGGRYATINKHVIMIGQSLALGGKRGMCISTTQPYTNLMPNGGVRYPTSTLSLAPLVESGQESPASGFANQIAAWTRAT